jgi:hypothetical protein
MSDVVTSSPDVSGIQGAAEKAAKEKTAGVARPKSLYIKQFIIVCDRPESTIKIFDSTD